MSVGGLSKARLGRMREIMAGHVERGDVPGLVTLVSRRGEVHVEAFGVMATSSNAPMRRDAIFRIASMTKPIVAAAAMILVEECKLRLDEPVDRLLPELANRRVLKRIDAQLDDTVPARRPLSLRDLLTFRLGFGAVMAPPGKYPIQKAIADAGLAPSPDPTLEAPDAWMASLGRLPLLHQPGEGWLYHTGSDVLGVLIARASGGTLETFLRERLFEPLGMKDTGFHVPADEVDRLPSAYIPNEQTGALEVHDEARGSRWTRPPVFQSGGGGLVSTVDDYLAFCQMMLNKGRHGRERILSRPSVELMTMDHLTPEQKVGAEIFFGDHLGWGFGMAVSTRRRDLISPGSFGWAGGFGTTGYSDPKEEMVGILMTQRLMTSPKTPPVYDDFWTAAYQAIDD
ncbi:serine hydrolase domain-containing protein [Polyangium aurulentum]|uniref:serine hydrolase domain-containing protein n=1 Tax=Polyangium aurulentum TaxID=2567896 RepID=UPI0010AEB94E|nr:serine hydrolase domain-containing protein [Polyangium aurulentum]UQA56848.1 beta-lactamase family protein [Polyangium aurulentum]